MPLKRKQHLTTNWQDIFAKKQGGFSRLVAEQNFVFSRKARGALFQVLSSINKSKGTTVLVPAFHCVTVVQPIIRAGFSVKFFNVKKDLSIDHSELKSLLTEDVAAVVIINYFGFEQDICNLKAGCEKVGALLIEDCSHSMMKRNPTTITGDRGHVAVYSFWKNIPSIVGAGIVINDNSLVLTEAPVGKDSLLNHIKFLKSMLQQVVENLPGDNVIKKLHLLLGNIRRQLKLNNKNAVNGASQTVNKVIEHDVVGKQVYPFIPVDYFGAMPYVAKHIINVAELEKIQQKVIENYTKLLSFINEIPNIQPVYSELHNRIVPWTLPVIMQNRGEYDHKLLKQGVNFFTFGETLHEEVENPNNISVQALNNARYLSESMICFSINQKINSEDLLHTYESLKKTFNFD